MNADDFKKIQPESIVEKHLYGTFQFSRTLECQRDEAREAMQWRPIESVPKDGTKIIVLLKGSDMPHSAYWHNQYEWAIEWRDGYIIIDIDRPTHWMPLPQPPVVDRGEG